ncbi:MAG: hypothetical protein ACPH5G_18470 [Pseudooceanicola atlanticus]
MPRYDTTHQSLGASLASVAVLAGIFAWILGWFVPDQPVYRVNTAQETTVTPDVVRFRAPARVQVSALPPTP